MAATRERATAVGPQGAISPGALYAKLSPGPGRSAVEVASHQRARIHGAIIEIVGERGYAAVTVRELTRLAGVSTRAFYEHFGDKEDCFLRTYEFVAREAATRVLAAQKRERGDWIERLRAGFRAYALELERQPRAARLALVDALTAGPAALERTRSAECMFEALIAEAFAGAPDGIAMPPILVEGIASGVEGVIRTRLLTGRERELLGLVDDLLQWGLCYRCEAALEIARLDGRSTLVPTGGVGETSGFGKTNKALSDERERILSAVAKLAAADGYGQLTVPRIRIEAGVSRRCFDAHFEGITDCFLTALELRVDRALSYAVRAAAAGSPDWTISVHRAISALCTLTANDPVLARLAFVEVFAPGLDGIRCRERLLAKIAKLFRNSAPSHQQSSELVAEASVDAIWDVLHHRVVSGQAHQLPRIAPALSLLALVPAIGAPSAADAIRQDLMAKQELPRIKPSKRPNFVTERKQLCTGSIISMS